eukprot:g3821.t1
MQALRSTSPHQSVVCPTCKQVLIQPPNATQFLCPCGTVLNAVQQQDSRVSTFTPQSVTSPTLAHLQQEQQQVQPLDDTNLIPVQATQQLHSDDTLSSLPGMGLYEDSFEGPFNHFSSITPFHEQPTTRVTDNNNTGENTLVPLTKKRSYGDAFMGSDNLEDVDVELDIQFTLNQVKRIKNQVGKKVRGQSQQKFLYKFNESLRKKATIRYCYKIVDLKVILKHMTKLYKRRFLISGSKDVLVSRLFSFLRTQWPSVQQGHEGTATTVGVHSTTSTSIGAKEDDGFRSTPKTSYGSLAVQTQLQRQQLQQAQRQQPETLQQFHSVQCPFCKRGLRLRAKDMHVENGNFRCHYCMGLFLLKPPPTLTQHQTTKVQSPQKINTTGSLFGLVNSATATVSMSSPIKGHRDRSDSFKAENKALFPKAKTKTKDKGIAKAKTKTKKLEKPSSTALKNTTTTAKTTDKYHMNKLIHGSTKKQVERRKEKAKRKKEKEREKLLLKKALKAKMKMKNRERKEQERKKKLKEREAKRLLSMKQKEEQRKYKKELAKMKGYSDFDPTDLLDMIDFSGGGAA